MALPPSYVPRDVQRSMPMPDPANPGRFIAAGLQQAGNVAVGVAQGEQETNARVAEIQYQQQRQSQSADFAARFAQARVDLATKIDELRTSAAPGGAGHAEQVQKLWEDTRDKLMAGVSNRAAQDGAMVSLAEYGGSLITGEQRWETGRRIEKQRDDFGVAVDAAGMLAARDPNQYISERDRLRTLADSLGLGSDDTEKLKRYGDQKVTQALISRQSVENPQGAIHLLDNPEIQSMLGSPELVDQLRRGASVEQRRALAEANAQAAHELKLQREQLATVRANLDTGAGKPGDWMGLAARYEAIGDTSAAAEARANGTEMAAAIAYRGANLPQLDSRINALVAKQGNAGLTPAEASELKGAQSLRQQQAERLNKDGGALLQLQFATGKTVAPLNLSDPASLQRRSAEALTAAKTYGRISVEPLLPEEVKPLRDLAEGNPAQRLQALQTIAGFRDPAAILGAARQISGRDDGSFRIAATFLNAPGGADLVRGILNGPDALKAHQQLWAAEKAKKVFDQYTGAALAGMPADYAADTFDAAKHFYAYRMAQAGASGWSDDAWRGAVEATLGGFTQGGEHKGGTALFNEQRVIIPSGWTAEGVFRRFARASGPEWSRAAGNAQPQWPDGSDVTATDLRKLLPVYVGGTRYAFRTRAGNFLQVKGGGTFVVDAAQVPWK